jgi:hypothetical protein
VCNYCKTVGRLKEEYGTGPPGGEKLMGIIDQIKSEGQGKKYDCVIGISRGTDLSFMFVKAIEWG